MKYTLDQKLIVCLFLTF